MIYKALKDMERVEGGLKCTFHSFMGKETVRVLAITPGQVDQYINGMNLGQAMPSLTAEERELFISGLDQEAWDELFQDSEEE